MGTTGTAVDNQASVAEINQAAANGTDALIVIPLSADVYTSAIKAARAKGIYVVAAGTGAPSTGQQSEAGTSGTQLGKLVADEVGAKNPRAVVGFLSEGPDQAVQVQAIDGFKAEARSKFPDMKVATSQFDGGAVTKDQQIVSNMLSAYPSINALYIINGASLAPAAAAVRQAGMTGKIIIIGNDVTPVSYRLISNGSMYGGLFSDAHFMANLRITARLREGRPVSRKDWVTRLKPPETGRRICIIPPGSPRPI